MAKVSCSNLPSIMFFLVLFLNDASSLAFGRRLSNQSDASSFLYARPLDYVTFFNGNYSASRGRAILGAHEEAVFKKSTKKLSQEETSFATASSSSSSAPKNAKQRQFQAAAHAVPSGANPESNK
ncbi:hypothetical protein LIER_26404 [Lithospermum erythrorhizon]|uniref:Uncharacterized protein n=1 Tax=Lithospermum erythrorhizon TaxID=34254 RepID=A0AAV3R890_LITER